MTATTVMKRHDLVAPLAPNVRTWRLERGMSQEQLAFGSGNEAELRSANLNVGPQPIGAGAREAG